MCTHEHRKSRNEIVQGRKNDNGGVSVSCVVVVRRLLLLHSVLIRRAEAGFLYWADRQECRAGRHYSCSSKVDYWTVYCMMKVALICVNIIAIDDNDEIGLGRT
jgi:hypothetical protein